MIEQFGSEEKCRAFLEALRWPDGIECPRCRSKKASRIAARDQFDCGSCRYQFSVTAGTIFHDSHLPLSKWFLATYIITESKKGISANQLKRMLNVTYRTAWHLCHRIRAAMKDEGAELLSGIVEADETYVGGKLGGFPNRREASRHRRDNKAVVVGAVQRGGRVRLRMIPDARSEYIKAFLGDVVADDAEAIYTDSHRSYRGIGDENTVHEYVDHSADEWVRGQFHTNTVESVWSLFKRSIIGAYHQISAKHMDKYLGEQAWRFDNRRNPYLFRDTLVKLLAAKAVPFAALVNGR